MSWLPKVVNFCRCLTRYCKRTFCLVFEGSIVREVQDLFIGCSKVKKRCYIYVNVLNMLQCMFHKLKYISLICDYRFIGNQWLHLSVHLFLLIFLGKLWKMSRQSYVMLIKTAWQGWHDHCSYLMLLGYLISGEWLTWKIQAWMRFEPWPLWYRCSALPVELSGQVGVDHCNPWRMEMDVLYNLCESHTY